MNTRRDNVNSLFGTYSATMGVRNFGWTNPAQSLDHEKDFILRETGILKDIKHISRANVALADPEDYLLQKNRDLLAISGDITNEFNTVFIEMMSRGFSQKEAQIRALESAKILKDKKILIHNENYPTKIRDVSFRDIK